MFKISTYRLFVIFSINPKCDDCHLTYVDLLQFDVKTCNFNDNQLLHFGLIEEIMRRTILLKITCFCRFDMEESNTSSSLIFSSLYSCLDLSTNGCKMRLIEMYDKIIDLILQAMYFCHLLRLKLN